MLRAQLSIALTLAVGAGCYGEANHSAHGYGNATPTLLYVEPGVQVIADNAYPVFFASGLYWQFAGGVWYDSPSWNRGWVAAASVPDTIRGITKPWAYAHYHRIGRDQPVMAFSRSSIRVPGVMRSRHSQWRGMPY